MAFRDNNIACIPENLLLDIFSCLPVKELCTIGRVCKKWRRIAGDNRLWRHVDLSQYTLDLRKMWKMIRSHFLDILLSLRVRGYMDPKGVNWKKHSLSAAMMGELESRCPNIQLLELVQCNLSNLESCTVLPAKLNTLIIRQSTTSSGWFEGLSRCPCHKTLTEVDLSGSTQTSATDLTHLACTKLVTLRLTHCYRVNDKAVQIICEQFPDLVTLDLTGTNCQNLGLHHIARRLNKLERLHIAGCRNITDAGISELSYLKSLRRLDIRNINIKGECLTGLKQIEYCALGLDLPKSDEEHFQIEYLSNCKTVVFTTDLSETVDM